LARGGNDLALLVDCREDQPLGDLGAALRPQDPTSSALFPHRDRRPTQIDVPGFDVVLAVLGDEDAREIFGVDRTITLRCDSRQAAKIGCQ